MLLFIPYCISPHETPWWGGIKCCFWTEGCSCFWLMEHKSRVDKDDRKMQKLWLLVSTWHCEWGWLERGGFWGGWADWCWVEGSTGHTLKSLDRSLLRNPGPDPLLLLRWWTTGPDREVVKTNHEVLSGDSWLVTQTSGLMYLEIIPANTLPCSC